MKKIILCDTGEELKLGDRILTKKSENTSVGMKSIIYDIILNKNNVSELVSLGIVKVIHMDYDVFITKIMNKLKINRKEARAFIFNTSDVCPNALNTMIFNITAIELDKQYPDHIRNSQNIYAISMANSKIFKMDKYKIKDYNKFAAFRSVRDALSAISIQREIMNDLRNEEILNGVKELNDYMRNNSNV